MTELPEQFVIRMRKMLGEEEFEKFLLSYQSPRHQGLRLNPLKTEIPEIIRPWHDLKKESTGSDAPGCSGQESLIADLSTRFRLRPVPWAEPYGFYYEETMEDEGRPGKSPLHEAGLYYIQEPSAMAVAALSGALPGEKILDLCAAPGGKSSQLAGMMEGRGLLVSNEINPGRAEILSRNMERMGVRNAVVTCESSESLAVRFGAFFDRVVVDAPCSGEGMFRKEEQALSMWSMANVEACAERQIRILEDAAGMVKSGGILVYSTCTFSPEEDEGTIARFLACHPEYEAVDLPGKIGKEKMQDWGFAAGRPEWLELIGNPSDPAGVSGSQRIRESLGKTIRLWPHRLEGEGHFIAVLQKAGPRIIDPIPSVEEQPFLSFRSYRSKEQGSYPARGKKWEDSYTENHKHTKERPSGKDHASPIASVQSFLKEELNSDLPESMKAQSGSEMRFFGDFVYLTPYSSVLNLQGLRVLRPGLQLGRIRNGRFEPSHSLAMALHPSEVRQTADYEERSREASAWFHGEAIPCSPDLNGWVLVSIDGISAGWGKASRGILKNHYPKGIRRPY